MFVLAIGFAASLIVFMYSANAAFLSGESAETVLAGGDALDAEAGTDELGERMYLYSMRCNGYIYNCASFPYNNQLFFQYTNSS